MREALPSKKIFFVSCAVFVLLYPCTQKSGVSRVGAALSGAPVLAYGKLRFSGAQP